MRSRKGTSLVEALVMLGPAVLILGAALMLMTRSAVHDSDNDARLSRLDALVIANERLQSDVAAAGHVEAEGQTLALDGIASARRPDRLERATYSVRRGVLARNDVPVRAAALKSVNFASDGKVLTMQLSAGDVTVDSTAFLAEQSARASFGTWVGAAPAR